MGAISRECYVVGVVGNPNCGKSTLFNALTGARQQVGNWPGVTVERKTGHYAFCDVDFEFVDLPGTYSLEISDDSIAVDEAIARDFVAAREADLIINIVDASNLERNLFLTTQLLEMKAPMLVALNMMDVAGERGIEIDAETLARRLDCPVVPIAAANGRGVPELRREVLAASRAGRAPEVQIAYPDVLEQAVDRLAQRVLPRARAQGVDARWLALRLLEGDTLAIRMGGPALRPELARLQAATESALQSEIDIRLAEARFDFVARVTEGAVQRRHETLLSRSERIDRIVLNRVLGIPIFLIVMHLMFMFTINIGGAFIDAFDLVSGAIVVDGFAELLNSVGSPGWLTVLLADGVGGGIQVVATFVPIVACLFLFLSILEDSGYMARAAFVMDRFLRGIGLPGKSFVPMIVGFGCTVPAVMATRTLENQRDRLMTSAMAPFMSCGARLPVYALFAAAFFAAWGQYVVFALYLIGIAAAVLTGLVLKHTLLRGAVSPFVMELPAYHLPTFKGVALRAWERTRGFIVRAGRVIVPMVLVLNVLSSIDMQGNFDRENSDRSVLSQVGRTLSPLFSPFGLNENNWPASVGIFTGLLAKEAVVGTLDSLYGSLAEQPVAGEAPTEVDTAFDVVGAVVAGLATIPNNLVEALGAWVDPLGLDIGDIEDADAAARAQAVDAGTFGAMAQRFEGRAGAFAYLLFVLLYAPCVAATAAVYRETGARWTVFVVAWTTGMAYGTATVFYQAMTFADHPGSSAGWIAAVLAAFALTIAALRHAGRRRRGAGIPLTVIPQEN